MENGIFIKFFLFISVVILSSCNDTVGDDSSFSDSSSSKIFFQKSGESIRVEQTPEKLTEVCLTTPICILNEDEIPSSFPDGDYCIFNFHPADFSLYSHINDYYKSTGSPNGPITWMTLIISSANSSDFGSQYKPPFSGNPPIAPNPLGFGVDIRSPTSSPAIYGTSISHFILTRIFWKCGAPAGIIEVEYRTATGGPYSLNISASCPSTVIPCKPECCVTKGPGYQCQYEVE